MSRLAPNLIKLNHFRTLSTGKQSSLPFESIPGPKPLPFIGNIWRYLPLVGDYRVDQLHLNAQYNRQRYGPIVREQITRDHTILHLFDPDDIEAFFRLDSSTPHRRSHRALLKYRREHPEFYNDGGLFPENGTGWARLRKLFQHYLMKRSEIAKRIPIMDEIALNAITTLANRKSVDNFEEFLYEWSLKSSLALFLDFRCDDMPDKLTIKRLIASLDDALEAIDGTEIRSERWVSRPNKCPYFQKLSRAEETMHGFVSERVDQLISTDFPSTNPSYVRDWIVRDQLDRKDVVTFILDCILAGLHATAYTTTFLLEHISALESRKQDELRRQVVACLPPTSQTLRVAVRDQTPLLRDCLKETLRLRPISIGTGRLTETEMVIRNYLVPANVMVIAQNQTICMDASIYEEPDQYRPERWLDYRQRPRIERPSAFAWLPFGFGPRACIGQRLITLQMHILAARLLQQYKWKFTEEIKTKAMLVHILEGNIKVELDQLRPDQVG